MKIATRLWASLVLVIAAAIVYRPAISAYFFDDDFQVLVSTWAFRLPFLVDITHRDHFYRPVMDLYYAASTSMTGGSPALLHLVNIAIHSVNGIVLFALAYRISKHTVYAFLAALFFVIQPSDMQAVAWVTAISEALCALFGCLTLLWFLRFRQGGASTWYVLSIVSFTLALLTHESAGVFLPLLALADWAFTGHLRLRRLAPYGALFAAYLMIAVSISSRSYLISEGHYSVGLHAISHALDYIVALYVGRQDIVNYVVSAAGLAALLLRGSRRVVFATSWLLLALVPFALFTWGNSSRYLYLSAMGFSMLLADGVMWFDQVLATRLQRRAATVATTLLAVVIVIRFSVFCFQNIDGFVDQAEDYRRYIVQFRQAHGSLPSHSRVSVSRRDGAAHGLPFLTALVQWEYRDPTIELVADEP
jgi:hypothetical protein